VLNHTLEEAWLSRFSGQEVGSIQRGKRNNLLQKGGIVSRESIEITSLRRGSVGRTERRGLIEQFRGGPPLPLSDFNHPQLIAPIYAHLFDEGGKGRPVTMRP
jgi:hypothetical protein